jgi:glutamyl-tRNA synthetase
MSFQDIVLFMNVRVRYAPSPTGLQHIGGIRTALFNYLFARSAGGKFILRLEDTDRSRFDRSYVQNLYDTFEWLGLNWDEGPKAATPENSPGQEPGFPAGVYGPYIQSERTGLYRKYAAELLAKGRAYYCFCTSERLEKIRMEREAAHSSETGYDRRCRSIPVGEAATRAAAGEACTIRLKIPLENDAAGSDASLLPSVIRFRDFLLGDIEWKNSDVNPDPVLLKSDGFPTYHLANVVDDHLMEISHVLRAQEWLSSTPLHVIMYRCFGWDHPEFCHLPMVMGEDGKKLSKRHGATSVDEFRRQGYLPEALVNYTALLGASYEEGKDIYTPEELAASFKLEKLNKAPAIFDYKKLEWYNGQYIRMKDDSVLAEMSLPWAVEGGLFGEAGKAPSEEQRKLYAASMFLVKERAVFLRDIPEKLIYLFSEPPVPAAQEFIPKKGDLAQAVRLLKMGRESAEAMAMASSDVQAEEIVKASAEKNIVKLGDLLMPLRVAVTGTRVSPPLFGSMRLLGPEKTLARIDRALAVLE